MEQTLDADEVVERRILQQWYDERCYDSRYYQQSEGGPFSSTTSLRHCRRPRLLLEAQRRERRADDATYVEMEIYRFSTKRERFTFWLNIFF